ncbi:MAG: hypothetical protein U0Q16_07710 [Bryobacteraceae bacterium]
MKTAALALIASAAVAQSFSQRGFLETRTSLYPESAPGDSGRAVAEALLRWEASWQARADLKFFGVFDARSDTHRQTEREFRVDLQDRRPLRPAFSLRRASVNWHRGPLTVEAGKQFIRWGKADILNPTDRFAPRDYLSVTDNDFLAVTAARLTIERGGDTVDIVTVPLFTPSRTPLLNQRWAVLPDALRAIPLDDLGARLPGRTQFGARWNHVGRGYEFSTVFYDGFHHLPLFDGRLAGTLASPRAEFARTHPQLRLYGGDVAAPTKWVTLKGEAAWFSSSTKAADEYVLWVAQAERTWGEWVLVGGYSGEAVTARRNPIAFAPDRGLARSILARAAYTIDTRRSVAAEVAIRDTGDGAWLKAEYSHQLSQHLRATASMVFIRGIMAGFIGQFHRNSHALLTLRYSF